MMEPSEPNVQDSWENLFDELPNNLPVDSWDVADSNPPPEVKKIEEIKEKKEKINLDKYDSYGKLVITIKNMMPFNPNQKILYQKVEDTFKQIVDNSSVTELLFKFSTAETKEEKKGKKTIIKKKDIIIADNEIKKNQDEIDKNIALVKSTLPHINPDMSLVSSKIINHIQRTNYHEHSKSIILGAYIDTLSKMDDQQPLITELLPFWLQSLPIATKNNKIKKQYESGWNKTKSFMKKEMDRLFKKDNREFIKFQLREVIGIPPNSLVDLALPTNIMLYKWQEVLLKKIYENLFEGGNNIFVNSTTTSGKTFITLSLAPILKKNGWKIIYLAPTEALIVQAIALLEGMNDSKLIINTYTKSLVNEYPNPDICLFTFDMDISINKLNWKGEKILTIIDEFHTIEKRDILDSLSNISKNVIICSATPANLPEILEELKLKFGRDVSIFGTPVRPVRMHFYNSNGIQYHPWINQDVPVKGLAPRDLYRIIDILEKGGEKIDLKEGSGDYDYINLSQCDLLEEHVINLLTEKPALFQIIKDKLKENIDNKEPININKLLSLIHKFSQIGNVMVFCENPESILIELVKALQQLREEKMPYWRDILKINKNFRKSYDCLLTPEYLAYLQEKEIKDATWKEDGTRKYKIQENTKMIQRKAVIENIVKERRVELEDLNKKHKSPLILNEIRKNTNFVTDSYEPPSLLRMGTYTMLNEESSSPPDIFFGYQHGIGHIDDDINKMNLEKMINIISWFNNQNINVLVTGRKRLSVGLNLSIRTVIIFDPLKKFTEEEINQMSGRAGRKGLDRIGETIIIK